MRRVKTYMVADGVPCRCAYCGPIREAIHKVWETENPKADRLDHALMCEAQEYRQRGYWRLMYCERKGNYIASGGEHLYRGPEGMK